MWFNCKFNQPRVFGVGFLVVFFFKNMISYITAALWMRSTIFSIHKHLPQQPVAMAILAIVGQVYFKRFLTTQTAKLPLALVNVITSCRHHYPLKPSDCNCWLYFLTSTHSWAPAQTNNQNVCPARWMYFHIPHLSPWVLTHVNKHGVVTKTLRDKPVAITQMHKGTSLTVSAESPRGPIPCNLHFQLRFTA